MIFVVGKLGVSSVIKVQNSFMELVLHTLSWCYHCSKGIVPFWLTGVFVMQQRSEKTFC